MNLATILGVSLQCSIIILLVALASLFLNKKFKTKYKKGIWLLIALRLIFLVDIDIGSFLEEEKIVLEIRTIEYEPSVQSTSKNNATIQTTIASDSTLTPTEQQAQNIQQITTLPKTLEIQNDKHSQTPIALAEPVNIQPQRSFDSGTALLLIWGLGAVLYGIYHISVYLSYVKKVNLESNLCQNQELWDVMTDVASEMGLRKLPEIRIWKKDGKWKSPFILGIRNPNIVLPTSDYNILEFYYIAKHELNHYARKDLWYKAILLIANGIHWFNPVVWLMRKWADIDLEFACDENVMKGASFEERTQYSEVIMSCVQKGQTSYPSLSTGYVKNVRFLKKRFKNLLVKKEKGEGTFLISFTLLCIILLGGFLTVAEVTKNTTSSQNLATDPLKNALTMFKSEESILPSPELNFHIEDYYITNSGNESNLYYIDENHVLWGAGNNEYGQLGQGTTDNEYHIDLVKIAEHVVHVDYTQEGVLIYLTDDKKLYGLGNASKGALQQLPYFDGNEYISYEPYIVPEPVLLMENIIYAVCGRDDIVALDSNGNVWTWGVVWYESTESYHYRKWPAKVLSNAVYITGGIFNHAALLKDGTLWTWGYNYVGNCGIANKSLVSEPELAAQNVTMVWTDQTKKCINCLDIRELEEEIPQNMKNTIIQKSDGSYWICGLGIHDGNNFLPRYNEDSTGTVVRSNEFLPFSMEEYLVEKNYQAILNQCTSEMSIEQVENILIENKLEYFWCNLDENGYESKKGYFVVENNDYFLYFNEEKKLIGVRMENGGSRNQQFTKGLSFDEVKSIIGHDFYIEENSGTTINWNQYPIDGIYYGFRFNKYGKLSGIYEKWTWEEIL